MQTKNAKNYVLDCFHNAEEHLDHAKRFAPACMVDSAIEDFLYRYAASVVMTIAYGKTTPTSYSDPEVRAVNKCLARLGAALRPGANFVDTYPILRYIPGYGSHLRRYQKEEEALYKKEVNTVRRNLVCALPSTS